LCFGKKVISNNRTYKVKVHSDRSLERIKAKLVTRGNTQKKGVDYTETLSYVIKMTTLELF